MFAARCVKQMTLLYYSLGRDRYLKQPGRFPIVRCRQCGLAYTNPRLTFQRLFAEFYIEEYGPHQIGLMDLARPACLVARLKQYLKQTTLASHYGYLTRQDSPRLWQFFPRHSALCTWWPFA